MSHFFYRNRCDRCNFTSKKDDTGSKSKGNDTGIRFRNVDESSDADGDSDQDSQRVPVSAHKPQTWTEIQYADVLVHRQSSLADKGILYAAGRRQTDAL